MAELRLGYVLRGGVFQWFGLKAELFVPTTRAHVGAEAGVLLLGEGKPRP